ncbi:hypothetical protein [Clostridium hydrogeniformans]|uniref:hypothetical protein n=1 Tax=Clostridium hydrogeniformans TaxID=349933 RepID=UPI00048994AE|nr:hypothetical protein [Clostridium hydrogeniformans]
MSKALEFINSEKSHYGKIFVDVSYAIDNVSPFLDKDVLENRKYTVKLPVIKKYIDVLEGAESEAKKSSGFMSMFKGDKVTPLVESFKRDNKDSLIQLENCSKCTCLNCTAQCNFASCEGCRPGSFIAYCDHERYNVTKHGNFNIELTNNRTGRTDRYKVMATMEDCVDEKRYIVIQNVMDNSDKYILHYYPGISEDDYGEITDGEEFDTIASLYGKVDV